MAKPTPGQPFQGNSYAAQAPPQAGPTGQSQGGFPERGSHSAQGQYQTPTQFEKYCVIHIATTCDEHGVYVTKDSAEVIEIGWTILDARDPALPEVCLISTMPLTSQARTPMLRHSIAASPICLGQARQHSHHAAMHLFDDSDMGARPQCRNLPRRHHGFRRLR